MRNCGSKTAINMLNHKSTTIKRKRKSKDAKTHKDTNKSKGNDSSDIGSKH